MKLRLRMEQTSSTNGFQTFGAYSAVDITVCSRTCI